MDFGVTKTPSFRQVAISRGVLVSVRIFNIAKEQPQNYSKTLPFVLDLGSVIDVASRDSKAVT